MSHSIEAEFLVDYSEEEPERKVRLLLDLGSVSAIQRATYAAGHHGMNVDGPSDVVQEAFNLSAFFRRLMTELEARSLFSMEEFKATVPRQEP